jgi:hypothetical protein
MGLSPLDIFENTWVRERKLPVLGLLILGFILARFLLKVGNTPYFSHV